MPDNVVYEIIMVPTDEEQEDQIYDAGNLYDVDQTSVIVEDKCEIVSIIISNYVKGNSCHPQETLFLKKSNCASFCYFNNRKAHYLCVSKPDSTMLKGCMGVPNS